MSANCVRPNSQGRDERGSIIMMTAVLMLLLFLMLGLCIDVSRIYLVRAELQNAADAAALAAARELNGGVGGIDDAVNQATNVIANTKGLSAKTTVTISSVQFAANLDDDPYLDATAAKADAANMRYVKVTTLTTSTSILFGANALGASHSESREAVAGRSVDLAGLCDFFPAAVGLANPSPTPGLMTLKFAQGSGTTATINDKDYIVLEVPCITGNGEVETARLAAGEPCACAGLGQNIAMTPSSNLGNGGRAAGDGMNTRFGVYAHGYGNLLQAETYPPDTNVSETITYNDYINKIPTQGNDRRVIIAPIVVPKDYPANTNGEIVAWGKFFLKTKMYVDFSGNCASNLPCGFMDVEYIGEANVNATGPVACGAGLTSVVLYR